MRVLRYCAFGLFLLSQFHCGTSRLSVYPRFLALRDSISPVTVLVDCAVVDGVIGDTDKIDIPENRSIADSVLRLCADSLAGKGYRVRSGLLTSMGLLMRTDVVYKIARTVPDDDLSPADLPKATAPFYLDESLSRDTLLPRLISVYSTLINLPEKKEETRAVIPDAVRLGRTEGQGGALLVLFVGGYNMPVGKGVNEAGTLASHAIALQRISQLSMLMFLIDSRSGEVIWDDRRYVRGGIIHAEKIHSMAADLLDELP